MHSSFIASSASEGVNNLDHLLYRLELDTELLELHGKALDSPCDGRPSRTFALGRLIASHVIEMIVPLRKKQNQQKDEEFVVRR
jgi:hypothetical protein